MRDAEVPLSPSPDPVHDASRDERDQLSADPQQRQLPRDVPAEPDSAGDPGHRRPIHRRQRAVLLAHQQDRAAAARDDALQVRPPRRPALRLRVLSGICCHLAPTATCCVRAAAVASACCATAVWATASSPCSSRSPSSGTATRPSASSATFSPCSHAPAPTATAAGRHSPPLPPSRQCCGLLKGQNDRLYQICNPAEFFPWCAQLVDMDTGCPLKQNGASR